MIAVPSFLLKRLYVKGSLRNNSQGFQFQLKNTLGSGYAKELLPITMDGKEIAQDQCYFVVEDKEVPFSAVTPETPFTLAVNKASTLLAKGITLSEGHHKIGIGFAVQGIGNLSFEVTDTIAESSE